MWLKQYQQPITMLYFIKVLTDTATVPCCHPLFVRHAPASPTMFALNSTFSSYKESLKHLGLCLIMNLIKHLSSLFWVWLGNCNCNVGGKMCQATKAIWHYWDRFGYRNFLPKSWAHAVSITEHYEDMAYVRLWLDYVMLCYVWFG